MSPPRIDDFIGNDYAYVGYLYQNTVGSTLAQSILHLEQLVLSRRDNPQTTIQVWSPPSEQQPPSKQPPGWMKRTAVFFENLAKTEEEWKKKRDEANLSSAKDIFRVADALLLKCEPICFQDYLSESDPDAALEKFGVNVGRVIAEYSTLRIASPFLSLIFLAACEVAIFRKIERPRVRVIQRKFLTISRGKKCEANDISLDKERGGARWLIDQTQHLFRRGFRHRAFELFLLEGRSGNFYKNDCPKHEGAHEEFAALVPSWDVPTEIQASMPFWIPFYIYAHFSRHWSYTEICEALGVEILNKESDWRRFHESYTSRELMPYRLDITTSSDQPTHRKGNTPQQENAKKRGRPRNHSLSPQVQGPCSIPNIKANDPPDNYGGSERSASEATVYQHAIPHALSGTQFTPVNQGVNATTSEQKPPGHEGSSAGQNHSADLHGRVRPLGNSDANSTVGADGDRFLQRTPTSDTSSPESDGGSSQAHTFNAEDVGEQQVTNSAALGDTQSPSGPANPGSGSGQSGENRSDDDHSDGRSNEDQSDQSSEGQFDDQKVEEAAPTRPRKRQRRGRSCGPPHSLPTPPASQSQTHELNGTFHPQFGLSSSAGIAPPNAHTITHRSPDIQFTAKGPRDRSPLDRERRGNNGAGLHQGDPIHVSSPPAPQAKGIIAGLVLPELSGTVEEQLAALISFGSVHWPPDDFVQFQPGKMITGRILDELLRLELKPFSNYALGVPPRRVTKTTADIIVWPDIINGNHWVIAIIDKKRKTFTSYDMTKKKMDECRGAYQEALQLGPLEAVSYPLQDYAGNTCAFRCCDALATYLRTRSETISDPVSLRLFYLKRLLQSRLQPDTVSVPTPQPISNEAESRPNEDEDEIGDDKPNEDEPPGAEWRAGQLPSGTRLDTLAKSRAVGSPEYNPSLTGADSPSVAVSLELRLAPGQEQNPLPGPNISLLDGHSFPVEHLTRAVNGDMEVGIEQQTPLGGGSGDHNTISETIFSRLEIPLQTAGSLHPLPSPTTQFQTWPNDRVHTAENNGNLTFLGGTLWEAGNELELASLPPESQLPSNTQEDTVAATDGGLNNKPQFSTVEQVVLNAREDHAIGSFTSGADFWSIGLAEDTGTMTDRSGCNQELVRPSTDEQIVPSVSPSNNNLMGFPADDPAHWFGLDEDMLAELSNMANLFSPLTP